MTAFSQKDTVKCFPIATVRAIVTDLVACDSVKKVNIYYNTIIDQQDTIIGKQFQVIQNKEKIIHISDNIIKIHTKIINENEEKIKIFDNTTESLNKDLKRQKRLTKIIITTFAGLLTYIAVKH